MTDADEYKYDCPQEGCGRETTHVEEDYFECRCGWFGQRISSIEDLEKEVKRLQAELMDAQDLLRANEYEICEKCGAWFDTEYPDECVGCEEQ